jgi:hypothetical protein
MLFKVTARAKEATGAPGKVLSEDTYKVQTVLMGFHREFGASVIFARGLGSGTQEREWKPNVAAHVQWLYRFRDESGWHKTWNAIEPGMGVHLASLDQGNQDIEFGLGGNVSLFQGLITGGVGFNLSNNERPYVFVGLSLLNALQKAKELR